MDWCKGRPPLVLEQALPPGGLAKVPRTEQMLCLVKTDTPGEYTPLLLTPAWGLRPKIAAGVEQDEPWAIRLMRQKRSFRLVGWRNHAVDVRHLEDAVQFDPHDVAYWMPLSMPGRRPSKLVEVH
ncbi:MAG: hypothetical protein A2Y38_10430 [Spirochaetes bacterium GWB1_59_5]|nr:MAG: hypothetical protein A2Y38_10430 [Spirochaetes bacterium GWB1_59_5]